MDHLLPYLILAASLAGNLLLFFSLKREILGLRARHRELSARLQAAEDAAEKKEELRAETLPAPPRPGFNLNTRVQVMRLWRQGEQPERIAALLGMPSKEVELLIRVRRMAAESAAPVRPAPVQPTALQP
jgi:hypothetical protein